MTREDSTPSAQPTASESTPDSGAVGEPHGWRHEREELLGLLAEAESQRVRDVRDHASQLLGLQQRASNDRDALSALHTRQIAELRQGFEAALADLHRRFDSLLNEARSEAARARELAASAESRAVQLQREQAATAARLEGETMRAERAARLLAEEQDRARLHPLQMDALRQAAAREQDRATAALGARAESAAALLVERERRAQAERLLLQLADELDRVQVRPMQELAARVQDLLQQLAVTGPPPGPTLRGGDGCVDAVPQDVDQLLQLADERFVRAAYRAVLDREPDPGGLAEHLRQVRRGVPRTEIVSALASSPEAQQRGGAPAWVLDWLAAATPSQRSAMRRIFSRVVQALLRPAVIHLHRIENILLRLEDSAMARTDGVAARVDAARAAVLTQLQAGVGEVVRRQVRLPAEVATATARRLNEQREADQHLTAEAGSASAAMRRARDVLGRSAKDAR